MKIKPEGQPSDDDINEVLNADCYSNYLKQYVKKHRKLPRRVLVKQDDSTKSGFKLVKYPRGWTKEKREKQKQIALSMPRNGYLFSSSD